MKPQNVDLVLLVDSSESMRPCFAALREHLKDLLYPLQQANFKVRFGLVAYAAAPGRDGPVYDHTFIGGSGPEMMQKLYSPSVNAADFFTSDSSVVSRVLNDLEAQGNEDTLLALDIAADFPFGPPESTRRVVAVFTDEPIEAEDGGDGLKSVDFKKLLAQMGKSISVSSLQMGAEPTWKKAIFGQNHWSGNRAITAANRRVVLAVGESAKLDTSSPLTRINVRLKWTAAVDLDLHAFCTSKSGASEHIYFVHREGQGIILDNDAGIGDRGGQNEENLTVTEIDRFEEILFATKIFMKGGSYSDYNGLVSVETNNGDDVTVPLTSRERADWCVIAKISNSANGTSVTNVNRVTNEEPSTDSF